MLELESVFFLKNKKDTFHCNYCMRVCHFLAVFLLEVVGSFLMR